MELRALHERTSVKLFAEVGGPHCGLSKNQLMTADTFLRQVSEYRLMVELRN